jgi:DsbC/DsbD-like thiol-disulfide interchange protein
MSRLGKAKLKFAAALVVLLAGGAAHSDDVRFVSEAVTGPLSTARLLSAGGPVGGVYHAGVKIALQQGAITYWRQPGDSGVPPVFDFSKSENLGSLEVFFPAPKHFEEAGSQVAGYNDAVVFPIHVTPRDAKAPIKLKLFLTYAACAKLCLPAKADLALELPTSGRSPVASEIADSEAKVPQKLSAAELREKIAIVPVTGDEKVWRLDYRGPEKVTDVFAEIADPFYLEAKPAGSGAAYELRLFGSGARESSGLRATLTLMTENGPFEAPITLD